MFIRVNSKCAHQRPRSRRARSLNKELWTAGDLGAPRSRYSSALKAGVGSIRRGTAGRIEDRRAAQVQ
jgi:hypothetical protein